MEIEYLKELGFRIEENIEALKISKGKVEFENDGKTSKIIEPDLRYYWDLERFGLHISNSDINFETIFQIILGDDLNRYLEILYLQDNDIINVSTLSFPRLNYLCIRDCNNLFYLELGNSKLLSSRCQIEELRVFNCAEFSEVSFNGKFDNLRIIEVTNCDLSDFRAPKFSKNLTYLNLSHNKIGDLDLTSSSARLNYVFASNNDLVTLQLSKSTQLNILDLSHNLSFSTFPGSFKSSSKKLESLNLGNTNVDLENLALLKDFENLKEINLENTPVQQTYPEEVEQGWGFLKGLFEDDKIPFLHQKVLLLGDPNIGKTNLLHWWNNNKHPETEEDKDSTHGVKYCSINSIVKTSEGKEVKLHFWDFGGQDYFHATHQLFFSKGSLNLLLWAKDNPQRESRNDSLYDIDYWLRCIQQLSSDSDNNLKTDTILIQNKFDRLAPPKPALVNQIDLEKAAYAKNLNLYFTNVLVNPMGEGKHEPKYLHNLMEQMSDIIADKDFARPKLWVEAYEMLNGIEKPVISLNEISSNENLDIKIIVQYFHDRGLVLYFEGCCEDKLFPKPDLFLDFLYNKLFENREIFILRKKVIREKIGQSVFKELLSVDEVLAILKHFNLVFEIPEIKDTYFIPQYLPKKNEWISFFETHQFIQPNIIIKSDYFLMNQAMLVIFKLFGRYTKKGEGSSLLFWEDGIIIEIESKLVQVKLNRKSQSIEIYLGKDSIDDEILEILVAVITNSINSEKLFELFNELAKSSEGSLVLVIGTLLASWFMREENSDKSQNKLLSFWNTEDFEIYIDNGRNKFVSFNELRKNSSNSVSYINLFQKYELESGIYALKKLDEITSIYGFNKYLEDGKKGAMKRLMISYSKDDLTLVNEFTKHLEPLVRNGDLQEWWYCTDLEAGQAWKDEIEPKLKSYEIICFMISSSFYNTKYIRDKEIQIVMDRYKNDENKPMIVPIILQPYHWTSDKEEYNLGKFTALPYTAKPVTSFVNRQEAWHIIGECLRVAIRNNNNSENEDFWLGHEKEQLPKDVKLFFEKIINENRYGTNSPISPPPSI